MKETRLVLCDIDGTLADSHRHVSKRTKETIARLHEHGIYFGLSSGRSLEQLKKTPKEWGFDFDFELLIGMNGSAMWDGFQKKRFDYFQLKRSWIKEIIELMAPFDLNPFIYWHDNQMLASRMDEEMRQSSQRNHSDVVVAKDISELYAEENAKVLFRIDESRMPEIEAYVAAHPSPYYKAFKTQTTMLEFADRRISKAYALQAFCRMNAFPIEQVSSFGDMSNDIEMLKVSGWGVCLLNGSADTKAAADDITEKTIDEDGFADYIEKHLFLPRGW